MVGMYMRYLFVECNENRETDQMLSDNILFAKSLAYHNMK